MSILRKLFGREKSPYHTPDVRFGRFSDAYKTSEQYDAWDKALQYFDEKRYMESYLNFFKYLKNPQEDNVLLDRKGQTLDFELRQGSLLIHGRIDGKRIRVEAALAEAEKRPLPLLRRLMELNYKLKYSRYALDNKGNLCIVFDSYLIDGSPYKLYYGLKELAIQADKLEDLLIDEFPFLIPVEREHIRTLGEEEKQVKYDYLCDALDRLFYLLEDGPLEVKRHPNTAVYLILETCYRLDYLLLPEGPMRELFEEVHGLFAAQDGHHPESKVARAKDLLHAIRRMDRYSVTEELYDVSSTFGRITPVDYEWVSQFVAGERLNMDWYLDNGLEEYALAVSGYITGYQLFHFAVPAPVRAMYQLYYQVVEEDFFNALGYDFDAHLNNGSVRSKTVGQRLREIQRIFPDEFESVDWSKYKLDNTSDARWARSYLDMIRDCTARKIPVRHGR